MINGRAIRLSYSSARSWSSRDDNPSSTSTDAGTHYNVIMEGPEIPNIAPPPPTPAMIAKTLANNNSGTSGMTDAYGNAYENPMFTYDPVYQVIGWLFPILPDVIHRQLYRLSSKKRCVVFRATTRLI